MAEKQQKSKPKILRAYGEPTHFTRKQIDEAVRKVRDERLREEKAARRRGGE